MKSVFSDKVWPPAFCARLIGLLLTFGAASVAAADAGREALAAWAAQDATGSHIYISEMRAKRWGARQRVTRGGGINVTPATAIDAPGRAWLMWTEYGAETSVLRFSRIENGVPDLQGALNSPFDYNSAPSIAVDTAGTLWVAWAGFDGQDDDIFFSRWDGAVWEAPGRIGRDDEYPDILPVLGLDDNGRPWVYWSGYDGDRYRPYASHWTGTAWTAETVLEEDNELAALIDQELRDLPALPPGVTEKHAVSVARPGRGRIQSLSPRFRQ